MYINTKLYRQSMTPSMKSNPVKWTKCTMYIFYLETVPNCIPHCQEQTCVYLCRHMLKCTCVDYVQGHLCKHVHKVYMQNVQHIKIHHCIMQINTLLNCTPTDNMHCVPSPHHPSDMGQVDTTLE